MSILGKIAALAVAMAAVAPPAHAGGLDVNVHLGFVAGEPRIVFASPPPAPVYVRPAPPCHDATWVDGQWAWDGYRWSWVDGYWLAPQVMVPQRPVYVQPQRPVYVQPQRPVYVQPQRPVYVQPQRPVAYYPSHPGRGHGYGHDKHDDHGSRDHGSRDHGSRDHGSRD